MTDGGPRRGRPPKDRGPETGALSSQSTPGVMIGAMGHVRRLDADQVPAWQEWPTLTGVAAILQIDTARVHQCQMRGELARYEAPDGTIRYNPEQVAAYQALAATVEQHSPTAKLAYDQDVVREAQQQAVALLKQSYDQHATLQRLYSEPIQQMMALLQRDNQAKDERIKYLEGELARVHQLREQMLDEQLERELARQGWERAQRRKDEAWKEFMRVAPDLAKGLEATLFGGSLSTDVADLFRSLDPDLLSGLLELDIISDEQKATIKRILARVRQAAPTNGQSTNAEAAEAAAKETTSCDKTTNQGPSA